MQEPAPPPGSPSIVAPALCEDPAAPMASEELAEELWLYGGSPSITHEEDGGSTPGHTRSSDTFQDISSSSLEQKDDLLQVTQKSSDDEDDSDTDSDDVLVTIGDIRTGGPPCMGTTGSQPVTGGRGYGTTGKLPQKGIDFAAPGCINGLPVLEVDLDSFEEKPWRKPGADLSDYFNYGFNEATWKVYCEKQRRLQCGLDSTYHPHSKENKITVQQGRMGHTDRGEENGFDNIDFKIQNPLYGEEKETSLNGKHGATNYDIGGGGEICKITRVEGRRWDVPEIAELPIEVVGNEEYKSHSVIQHQQPPPPLLPPPTIAPNPPPFNRLPPPPLFFQRPPPVTQIQPPLHPPALMPPPLVPPPTVHIPPPSGPHVAYNSRPPPCHSYFPPGQGLMNYSPASNAHNWVTTSDKGTNSLGGNDWTPRRRRDREIDRVRNQNSNNYKTESDRFINNSHSKSYDYERKYLRSRELSWEREEKLHGGHRHREKEESGKHKSRRNHDSEERESHRRHKRKKSKRSKEEKSGDEELPIRGSRRDLHE